MTVGDRYIGNVGGPNGQLGGAGGTVFSPFSSKAPSGDYPAIYGNFATGQCWANGVVQKLSNVFVYDADWGVFNPANIIPGAGLLMALDSNLVVAPIYNGGLMTAGATIVVKASSSPGTIVSLATVLFEMDSLPSYVPEYTAVMNVLSNGNPSNLSIVNQTDNLNQLGSAPLTAGNHGMAATFLPTAVAQRWAIDGAVQTPLTATAIPTTPFDHIALSCYVANLITPSYIVEFMAYRPQPAGDLAALSAP